MKNAQKSELFGAFFRKKLVENKINFVGFTLQLGLLVLLIPIESFWINVPLDANKSIERDYIIYYCIPFFFSSSVYIRSYFIKKLVKEPIFLL